MHLHFLGTGDAFGSGGRFNTCFLIERAGNSMLIDCGASSMIAMRRFGVDPNSIAAILLTHLHGDHFGGLPFFILDAQLVSRRTRPLAIIGPKGTAARSEALMEVSFPGSSKVERRFAIETIEIDVRERTSMPGVDAFVTGFPVRHPSGAPSLALRVECDRCVVAYTGDTEWTDELLDTASAVDLLIAEAYTFERPIPFHLDFATLREKLPLIGAKRVVLTHMSRDMLARNADAYPGCEVAFDGMRIEL
jgi:ribonuclease BN (tRNA processing enzyme)